MSKYENAYEYAVAEFLAAYERLELGLVTEDEYKAQVISAIGDAYAGTSVDMLPDKED